MKKTTAAQLLKLKTNLRAGRGLTEEIKK